MLHVEVLLQHWQTWRTHVFATYQYGCCEQCTKPNPWDQEGHRPGIGGHAIQLECNKQGCDVQQISHAAKHPLITVFHTGAYHAYYPRQPVDNMESSNHAVLVSRIPIMVDPTCCGIYLT